MALATDGDVSNDEFAVEDMSTGMHASGFGRVGDGRSFAFQVHKQTLSVEVYRPRLAGPVPQAEDVVAVASRSLAHVDVTDERSLAAAVRDAVADANPVPRPAR
ncbi:hypothetical protein [Mycolicibacterium sp. 050158]|jgi:hypothetical protein|uniref:hypothetical protein n=1 Tax=Mycolicibacterium sp. 050158 TaxID=3090602 RepID=UPI00299F490E|nr:hypothetical protein [Mycolicibacterium sp. 050158]MDX1892947.1 hypothetical protein [Mycolicibacterium sp. 050158]